MQFASLVRIGRIFEHTALGHFSFSFPEVHTREKLLQVGETFSPVIDRFFLKTAFKAVTKIQVGRKERTT